MNPQWRSDASAHTPDGLSPLAGKPPAVGIAQHDPIRASFFGGLQALQCILRIRAKAVEKMLRVEDDFVGMSLHISDGIRDDLQICLLADSKVVSHVEIPGLADQGDHKGIGLQENFETKIL